MCGGAQSTKLLTPGAVVRVKQTDVCTYFLGGGRGRLRARRAFADMTFLPNASILSRSSAVSLPFFSCIGTCSGFRV